MTRHTEALGYLLERERQAERALTQARLEVAEAQGDELQAAFFRADLDRDTAKHHDLYLELEARRFAESGKHSRYSLESDIPEITRRAEKYRKPSDCPCGGVTGRIADAPCRCSKGEPGRAA